MLFSKTIKKSEKPERCFKNKIWVGHDNMAEFLQLDTVGVQCKKILYAITKIKHLFNMKASVLVNEKHKERGRTPPQTVIMLCIQHFYKRKKKHNENALPISKR